MNKLERRDKLIEIIRNSNSPVNASALAAQLQVSRQIIVGDIALLRASGLSIAATPTGYILESETNQQNFGYTGIIACRHDDNQLIEELYTIVDFGGTVLDVTIDHSTYGQISGRLDISSRHEVNLFLEKLSHSKSKPLSDLTGGIHLHKIGCRNKETFDLIVSSLVDKGLALT